MAVRRIRDMPVLSITSQSSASIRVLASAHDWDASSVAALDAITAKYAAHGKTVEIIGLNEHSAKMHGALDGDH